ncbi:alcohol dehydrogenase catalytic domain-containing protein [Kribbella sp. VKM Ac-2566]|uniref:alcohol dehydrogenase catalytic domain-containing protein n=1 Tax=Kribbella sp. VKM Ac-2566 TaxID=2512218 RepID=UPI0010E626D9|nr:alcohol dehydrogenase catalytic domain-containing protein [Kribbella sp. VKM Ac-2566]TDX03561.1 L-idonate 5-dehydrogenase [Kribbella sp. VKM Ac-2566]
MPVSAVVPRFRGGALIEWADHEYREPGPGELRLRIAANAICGTDRHEYYDGSPIVPGHEAAGIVVDAGPGTTTETGSPGVVYLMDYCGDCRSCRAGATNQCFAKRGDVGQNTDGGYGPYAVVHETNFFAVGNNLDLGTATMLLDVMGTSSHALTRARAIRPDIESIFVAGAGPIGLGLLVMAKVRFGPDFPVYLSDVSAWRRRFAESLGGVTFDAGDNEAILDASPDMSFDSSGKQAARELALKASGKRGGLICVGHGEGLSIDVSRDLIAPERAIVGSEYFRYDELPENLELLERHQDYIGKVITHRMPVGDLDEAFRLFFSGETGKVVVTQEAGA